MRDARQMFPPGPRAAQDRLFLASPIQHLCTVSVGGATATCKGSPQPSRADLNLHIHPCRASFPTIMPSWTPSTTYIILLPSARHVQNVDFQKVRSPCGKKFTANNFFGLDGPPQMQWLLGLTQAAQSIRRPFAHRERVGAASACDASSRSQVRESSAEAQTESLANQEVEFT